MTPPQFNFTSLDHPAAVKRTSQERDIIQSLQSGAGSAINGVATVIPNAISQVQTAVGTGITEIPNAIEALIPRNCSIGTKEYCVGKFPCRNLPLNFSSIIPAEVERIFQLNVDDVQSLKQTLTKVTAVNMYHWLVLGLVLLLVLAIVSACPIFFPALCLTGILGFRFLRVGVHITFSLICCIPFIIAAVIFLILGSKAKHLPPWVQVEEGPVGKLCLGASVFGIIMTISCGIMVAVL